MRLVSLFLGLLSSLSFANDQDFAKRILGTWRFEMKESGMTMVGTTRYNADGTWSSDGTATIAGEKMRLISEGKWRVEGEKLTFEVTKSNDPDFLKIGEKWSETVISITDSEFRYLDQDGKEVVENRVK